MRINRRSIARIGLIAGLVGLVLTAQAGKKKNPDAEAVDTDLAAARASELIKPDQFIVYKKVGDVTLKLHVFNPPGHKSTDKTPAAVFFFGGGFRVGKPSQFYGQAQYLASRGMVAISAEYRIKTLHGTDPDVCVTDAKSAMRWVRAHAAELGIDPDRIAAGGGSAGGFLAAATATLTAYDEAGEDTSVTCHPNALLIFNGNFDRGPGSSTYERVRAVLGDRWPEFSPLHNIHAPFPPTLFQVGTQDKLISVEAAKKIETTIKGVGGRCDLHFYEGQGHGFFNYGKSDNKYYKLTLIEADKFLTSLGYLKGEPTMKE